MSDLNADYVVLRCPCGHSITDHPTERLYWTGDGDSPCRHCSCEDYNGEGYPARHPALNDGLACAQAPENE